MIRDTARYAKRQMTWFARDPEVRWIEVGEGAGVDALVRRVLRDVREEGLVE